MEKSGASCCITMFYALSTVSTEHSYKHTINYLFPGKMSDFNES